MALVHHDDDIVAGAQLARNLLEAEDGGDDDFANVLPEHGHQLVTGRSRLQIAYVG